MVQEDFLDIALIITSIALVVGVVLQSKGAGLGGLTGGDSGGVFSARRGIEKNSV
ncbi:MAG: preprotein translocase subunit SecG [Chloroflexota bacterium]